MGTETLTNGYHSPEESLLLNHHVAPPCDQEARRWVIHKYGGTSAANFPKRIAEDIVRSAAHIWRLQLSKVADSYGRPATKNNRIAVVCSARSSSGKTDGTTNR